MSNVEGIMENMVGPVLRGGDIAEAAVEAMIEDNPGKNVKVDDHKTYVRVSVDRECLIKAATMSEILGCPFEMQELEINMSAFAGQIETTESYMRFYLNSA